MCTRCNAKHSQGGGFASTSKRLFVSRLSGIVLLLLLATYGCRLFSPSPAQAPASRPVQDQLPITTSLPETADSTEDSTSVESDVSTGGETSSLDLPFEQASAMLVRAQGDLDDLSGVPEYEIQLTIQPDLRTFTGHASMTLTGSDSPPSQSVYFRLLPNSGASYGGGALTVTRVLVDDQEVQPVPSGDDSILELPLPDPLQPGEWISFEFDFTGSVPVDFGGEETPDAYGIYNYSQGVLVLSAWYPQLAVYDEGGWHLDPASPIGDSVFSETTLYTVSILAPEDLVVIATGVEVSQEPEGDLVRHDFMSGPVRDFFIVASPALQRATQEVNGTRVNSYYYPADQTGGEVGLSIAAESLRSFNQHFGEYPFVELDIVQAPMRNALGVEFPGIVMIAESLYQDVENPSFAITIAHEVAHQWWYSVVGNDVFAEPWLDEAMSTYASGVYYQDAAGEDAYQGLVGYWQERYDTLVKEGLDDVVTQDLAYFESLDTGRVYGGVVYTKGALFLKAVRDAIGDEAFFKALQDYYHAQKYQVATGDDLLEAFERASGQQLDPLYQEWLFSK